MVELSYETFRVRSQQLVSYSGWMTVAYFFERGIVLERNTTYVDVGIPDYRFSQGGKTVYVEAKAHNGGMRPSQIKWLAAHPTVSVMIVYVEIHNEQGRPLDELMAVYDKYLTLTEGEIK